MTPHIPAPPVSVDAYLTRLRTALGSIPSNEAEEIVREFHGHIVERQGSAAIDGRLSIAQILRELGSPEAIGAEYLTNAFVQRARTTFSPVLIWHATIRLAWKTLRGFVALLLGIIGYGFGLPLVTCAALKPFFPHYIGLWIHPHGIELATAQPDALGPELLGWWIIPTCFALGTLTIIGTTLLLRWMLRFASGSPAMIAALV